jgi:hypothetical protein
LVVFRGRMGGELEGEGRRESSSVVTPRCLLEDKRTEERSQVLYWAMVYRERKVGGWRAHELDRKMSAFDFRAAPGHGSGSLHGNRGGGMSVLTWSRAAL